MDVYLDASVIVALLTNDALTSRARAFLQARSLVLFIGDYAVAEVASVIARRVRTGELTEVEARASFDGLDNWTQTFARPVETTSDDIAMATEFIRRLDLTLRAPDANTSRSRGGRVLHSRRSTRGWRLARRPWKSWPRLGSRAVYNSALFRSAWKLGCVARADAS